MNLVHLKHLVCPKCKSDLTLAAHRTEGNRVRSGTLSCASCSTNYPVREFIPRFVSEEGNYASGFGYQWNKHSRSQYDSYSGAPISEKRFFNSTGWPRKMPSDIILEAGSGSGRFTEHAASTKAVVVSFDYSNAVDANYQSNGHFENLLIVQASIYEMPFRLSYFTKVVCIGVIQHTPFPLKSFLCLADALRSGGSLVVDAYIRLPWWKQIWLTKYWVRPLTRRLPPESLYRFCNWWVNLCWGVTGLFVKLTGRRILSWFLLIADYRGVYPLSDKIQKEWAILDSFDMLNPAYDFPQSVESVRSWFNQAKLEQIDVGPGYNGIYGRGIKS